MTYVWPDFCKKETLAKRLDLPVGAIDQLVKRGILPQPVAVGEALLWHWDDVKTRLVAGRPSAVETAPVEDPFAAGARRVAEIEAAAARGQSPKQNRQTVLLPS